MKGSTKEMLLSFALIIVLLINGYLYLSPHIDKAGTTVTTELQCPNDTKNCQVNGGIQICYCDDQDSTIENIIITTKKPQDYKVGSI